MAATVRSRGPTPAVPGPARAFDIDVTVVDHAGNHRVVDLGEHNQTHVLDHDYTVCPDESAEAANPHQLSPVRAQLAR